MYVVCSPEQGGQDFRTLIIGWSGRGLVRAGEAIQQNTNLVVTTYTSLDQVDNWPPARWAQAFREAQVSEVHPKRCSIVFYHLS